MWSGNLIIVFFFAKWPIPTALTGDLSARTKHCSGEGPSSKRFRTLPPPRKRCGILEWYGEICKSCSRMKIFKWLTRNHRKTRYQDTSCSFQDSRSYCKTAGFLQASWDRSHEHLINLLAGHKFMAAKSIGVGESWVDLTQRMHQGQFVQIYHDDMLSCYKYH